MSVEQRVREHFHADAVRFDAIYEDKKGLVTRFVDNVWRGVVRKRLDLSLKLLAPLEDKRILDVGCGSGRYCIAFAQQGAQQVVGVDFAQAMIELARAYARQAGVEDRCDFRVGSFPDAVPDGPFDACTAMGFFDYVGDPVRLMAQMRLLTRGLLVMSFPKAREWRVPVRRAKFWLKGCPLFLYGERQLRRMLVDAGIDNYDWIDLVRDYIVVARCQADISEP